MNQLALSRLALCAGLGLAVAPVAAETAVAEPQIEEQLIVVGSRLPVPQAEIGHAVSVLDAQRIADAGSQYGADLFRLIPGVAVNRTGGYGGLTQVRVRGSEANHVVVLVDGLDVSAAGSGEFDFSSLLSADIDRIEVLRGPQSGLYGSNALAGVINVQTRMPDEGIGFDTTLEGGGDSTRHGAVSISGGSKLVRGRLNYSQRRSEFDVSSDDSQIGSEDDQSDNRTLSGQLLLTPDDRFDLRILGRHTRHDTETDGFDFTGGPQQGLAIDDSSNSDTETSTFGAVSTLRLAEDRSTTRLSYERTWTELDGGTFGDEAERIQWRLDSSYQWSDDAPLSQRSTLFLHHEEESFRNRFPFDPSQIPEQDRDLVGFGLEHRLNFEQRVFLSGTVRRDNNDRFEDATTWSLSGSVLTPDQLGRLHASIGRAVTNPTFVEQFGFVPGQFVGNPNLRPENAVGWDLGVEMRLLEDKLLLDATWFSAELEDEIQNQFPTVVNSANDSDRRGVELSGRWLPDAQTTVDAAFTWTDADDGAGGREQRRPKYTASVTAARQWFDGRARTSVNLVYTGEQVDSDFRNFFNNGFVAEAARLDSFLLANLRVSYQVTDQLEVFARIENLFDEDYEEVLSYATPGRRGFAGVRFRL